jgi:hypothetical protein
MGLLTEFVGSGGNFEPDAGKFLFYPSLLGNNERKKFHEICIKVNNIITNSKN